MSTRVKGGFGSSWHLVRRFFGALVPIGPPQEAERWARAQLTPAERSLFAAMSNADRRHAVGVARRAVRLAGDDHLALPELPPAFVTAALLHDVGKNASRLGTFGRVGATMAALALGRERVLRWEHESTDAREPLEAAAALDEASVERRTGARARMAVYLRHDAIGAAMLEQAGSDAFAVAWAREHHLGDARWSIDRQLGDLLKRADGD